MNNKRHISSVISQIFGKFASTAFPPFLQKIINISYVKFMGLDMREFNPASTYTTLNELFTRRLNKARKYTLDGSVMISPCDALVSACGKVENYDSFQIKGVSYKIDELLGDFIEDNNKKRVKNGDFINFYLSPSDYHRYHIPINCKITKAVHIPGKLYPVNFTYLNKQPNLFIENERVVLECYTHEDKLFYMVLVGALNVGKMEISFEPKIETNSSATEPTLYEYNNLYMNKGDDFGCFKMGSTIVLISEQMNIFVRSGEKVGFGQDISKILE